MTTGAALSMALAMVGVILTLITSSTVAHCSRDADRRFFLKASLIFAVLTEACIIAMAVLS